MCHTSLSLWVVLQAFVPKPVSFVSLCPCAIPPPPLSLSLSLGCNKVHLASQSLPPSLHPQPAHNYYSNSRGNSSVTQCACVYSRERLEPAISKIGGRRTKLLMSSSLSLPRHLPCVLDLLMRYESLYTHAHEYACQASHVHDLVIIITCFSDNLH